MDKGSGSGIFPDPDPGDPKRPDPQHCFKGTKKKSFESPKWVTFRANRLSYNSRVKIEILL